MVVWGSLGWFVVAWGNSTDPKIITNSVHLVIWSRVSHVWKVNVFEGRMIVQSLWIELSLLLLQQPNLARAVWIFFSQKCFFNRRSLNLVKRILFCLKIWFPVGVVTFHYICRINLTVLLLHNLWSNLKKKMYKCSIGECLSNLFKLFVYICIITN